MRNDDFKNYVRENDLEDLVEKDTNYDLIAHDLHCPCGKDTYRYFSDAKKAIKQRGSRGKEKDVYKCTICGYFHLTSKTKKDGVAKKRFNKHHNRGQNKTQKTIQYTSALDEQIIKERKQWRGNKGCQGNRGGLVYTTKGTSIESLISEDIVKKLNENKDE